MRRNVPLSRSERGSSFTSMALSSVSPTFFLTGRGRQRQLSSHGKKLLDTEELLLSRRQTVLGIE